MAALVAGAALWIAVTVVTAVSQGEGRGFVFWAAIALLMVVFFGLVALVVQILQRPSDKKKAR